MPLKLIAITAILLVLELVYLRLARRFGILDIPNCRGSQNGAVLRGGGIVFLLGAWVFQAFFGWHYPAMMAGLTAVGLVSFADDVHTVSIPLRLLAQFLAVALMAVSLGLPGHLAWWIFPLILVLAVGIINAYNFMDGINGITAAYSLAVLIPLLCLNQSIGFIDQTFLVVMTISVLIFSLFNFRNKALCFAGDVGSISIAYVLAFAIGALILATQDFVYFLLLAVYGVDTSLTIVHRILLRESLTAAHRKHAYQIMSNELHIPQLLVASGYAALQLLISFGLMLWPFNPWIYFAIVIALLSAVYVIFMRRYYPLHKAYLKTLTTTKRHRQNAS